MRKRQGIRKVALLVRKQKGFLSLYERADERMHSQVLQGEVERLEMRAALFEEAAGRTGQLEDEARVREEQLQALRDQVGCIKHEVVIRQTKRHTHVLLKARFRLKESPKSL